MSDTQRFTLLVDGACPFCRREARWLRRIDRHQRLAFEDISSPGFDPARFGITKDEAMGVIHGIHPDGRVVRGVEVFRQAYAAIGLGCLLAPTGWPLLRPLFDALYGLFARYRIPAGKLFGRSCETGTCAVPPQGSPQHTISQQAPGRQEANPAARAKLKKGGRS
jgi:predicted DCC family thiol-disulfide oxidoreductase YuxK